MNKADALMRKLLSYSSKLLFLKWELKEGEHGFTIMRIKISGIENGNNTTYEYTLLDRFQNDTISMARTTGFTCTAVAKLVVEKKYTKIGISPPERM